MNHSDRREIRKLLKMGSPIQNILDEIPTFERSSLLVSGKSGSGKSQIAIGMLKELCLSGYTCSYFDIENNNTWFFQNHKDWMTSLLRFKARDIGSFYENLKKAAESKSQIVVLDCLNKICESGLDSKEYSKFFKGVLKFCKENSIFPIIFEHNKVGLSSSGIDQVINAATIEHHDIDTILFKFLKLNESDTKLSSFLLEKSKLP